MHCNECGSKFFILDGSWYCCKQCGRVVDVNRFRHSGDFHSGELSF